MLASLVSQPPGIAWPTREWPLGSVKRPVREQLQPLLAHAFADVAPPDLGETHGLVIIKDGQLVEERYGNGFDANDTFPSWSMAKSITHALIGILVGDGKIDIHAPAVVPEWKTPNDPRRTITLDHLLRMSSGLKFLEEYLPDKPSDVIAMLFGEGKEDVAHFAASFDLAYKPGTFWSYSSGTTNIISRAAAFAAGAHGADFESFMRQRLFDPLGMKSAQPRFDTAGTFIGSSFCFATARDFARFGTLYLRDGVWEASRLLPRGWVDYGRTATWQQPCDQGPYGAHWWLDIAGPGTFSANGYEGQFTVIVPQEDMVIVRHGRSQADQIDAVKRWIKAVADCFRS